MSCFEFEATCASRSLYQVMAEALEEAIQRYRGGMLDPQSEEVEGNCLVDVRRDGVSIIPEAESRGLTVRCEACESAGHFYSEVPGVLAHLRDGRCDSRTAVERCDACCRFESDEAAFKRLVELGLATLNS